MSPQWSRVDRVASVRARIGWKALTASEYQEDGYAFLSTPNIKSRDIDFSDVNYISEFRWQESPELQLAVGDVLLSKDGSLGIVNVVRELPRPTTVNGSIAVVRPQGIDSGFLAYALQADFTQAHIQQMKDGMGVPHLFQWDINRIPVPTPPMDEQRRIADFLDHQVRRIDNIISTRQNWIDLMGEAPSVWFGEALADHGVALPVDLEVDLRAMKVPLGWSVRRMSHLLLQFTNGFVGPTRDILVDEGVRYIQSMHVKNGEIDFDRRPFFVTQDWYADRPRIHLRQGDIVIVQTGDIGQVAEIPEDFGPAACHALLIARVNPRLVRSSYLAEYLRSSFGRESMLCRATGAMHPHLEAGIKDIAIIVPPLDVQAAVVGAVELRRAASAAALAAASAQVALLQERKRSLITAAVTGELDVATASLRAVGV